LKCPSCDAQNPEGSPFCGDCGAVLGAEPTLPTPAGRPVAGPADDQLVVAVDLRPGTLFDGRYEVLGLLGRGGMGSVYRAHDRALDETVAIKILRPDFAQDPQMHERFKSEIKLARKVRHKNVCTIHHFGEHRGLLYISMELLDGVDLKKVVREHGALAPEKGYEVAIQVAEGLAAVHEAGIVHRDLKTPNIILDRANVARLLDFGVAKRLGETTLTATGQIVGTPEYMSPEQAQGNKADFRSDIYALGIVVYEIFTGHVPFRGDTPISTILKQITEPPPLDGPVGGRLPAELKPVLRRALAKEPAERFGSAHEMAEALRQARSPSRRQQPVPTAALRAPTLSPRTAPPRAPVLPGRAWLWALPALGVALGALALWRGQPGALPPSPVAEPTPVPSLEPTPPAPAPPSLAPSAVEVARGSPAPTPVPLRTPPAPDPTPRAAPWTRPVAAVAPATPTPAPLSTATPRPQPPPTPTPLPVPAPAPAEGPGLLQVAVRPWGSVSVDGKLIGDTPLDRISLSAGPHLVRVRHPAYEVWERQVIIRPGQTEKVLVDFVAQGTRR
jgi:serine/threonine-protein kinase